MDLRKLRYFVGIAEAGGFTRAAETLRVAQSALSLHVRQMEEEFGVQLLNRDRNGIVLTETGKKLLHHAKIILEQVRIAENELMDSAKSPAGVVTLAIPSGLAQFLAPALIAATSERFPDISLKILEGMSGPISDWILDGRVNLAILYKSPEEAIISDILAEEEFHLIIPPGKPPFADTVHISELHQFPMAVPMDVNNVRRSVGKTVACHGYPLDIRHQMDSISSIVSMVMAGTAYSILTLSTIQREVALGHVRTARIVDPEILCCAVLAVNPRESHLVEVSAIRTLVPKIVRQMVSKGIWVARQS